MKLLRLHVENFGKLSGLDEQLSDGLNVRREDNGWGKSTLAVFIKAMLYGLPVSTKQSLQDNERKRYTPWQGGAYGGSLDIEVEGKCYRIERLFGSRAADDVLHVTELNTGRDADVPWAACPGEGLFGIDAAAYERTTYLSQRQIDRKEGMDSIHAKLNDLADATDDLTVYETAQRALDNRRRFYQHLNGGGGHIPELELAADEAEAQLQQCRVKQELLKTAEVQLAQTEREWHEHCVLQQQNEQMERDFMAEQQLQGHGRTARTLQRDVQALEQQLQQRCEEMGGSIPGEEQLTALRAAIDACTAAERAEQELRLSESEQEELDELSAQLATGSEQQRRLTELRLAAQEYDKTASASAAPIDPERQEELSAAEQQRRALRESFGEAVPSDEELKALRAQCRGWSVSQHSFSDRVAQLRRHAQELEDEKKRIGQLGRTLLISVLVALAVGLGGFALPWLFALGAGLLAVVLPIGIQRLRQQKALVAREQEALHRDQKALEREADRLTVLRGDIEELLKAYGVPNPYIEQAEEDITLLERRRTELELLENYAEQALRQAQREQELCQAVEQRFAALWQQLLPRHEIPAAGEATSQADHMLRRFERLEQLTVREQSLRERRVQAQASIKEQLLIMQQLLGGLAAPHDAAEGEQWFYRLSEARSTLLTQQQQLEHKRAELTAFCTEHGLDVTALPVSASAEEDEQAAALRSEQLSQQRVCWQERQTQLTEQLLQHRREVERLSDALEELDVLEGEVAKCNRQLAEARERLWDIQKTQDYLKKAREALTTRYLSKMQQHFGTYIATLTGKDAPAFTMNGDLALKVREGGIGRSPDSFSTGTRDLFALCARLSMVDAMFESERPFLILDDPFVNLDDKTVTRARALLDTIAQRYQVLYFACSESRI